MAAEPQCKYPGCKLEARASWALVPVCYAHQESILKETFQYYEKRIVHKQREHFLKIKPLIPFKSVRHAHEVR